MLTSFFGKSKPINYILLSVAIIIGYFFGVLTAQEQSLSLGSLSSHGLVIFLMVFAVLLLDFIIRKNNVTKNNTFAILLFVLFVLLVPEVYNAPKLILANIFVLLATRRILSLTTSRQFWCLKHQFQQLAISGTWCFLENETKVWLTLFSSS